MRTVRAACATTLALIAAIVTVVATAGSASAAVSASNYVALGDSYSSGVGSGDYDPASGDCDRSPHAYPQLWATEHASATFAFVACSGATTDDVLADQVSALSTNTTAVSITIGGNDAGFSDVMETCVLGSDSTCDDAISNAENFVTTTLPSKLDNLYATIRQDAPSAAVVVLGYPRFYQIPGSCILGLSEHKRSAINTAADTLDGVIADRAAAAGFTFSDVRDEFTGHEICSDDEWLHSVSIPLNDSYHPTAAGQSGGYLPALDSVTG
ncbi:MAG TPA: SGNH/GDSL hydrolase family protein [Mycobacteriales bacterium]|nr:SGNH/GDSL hydrolase family protein [Mycobacteriales bacterium]